MLRLHRSDRADGLLDALGALLAAPPDDPFSPEVIAVPTRGMERWITQRLSDRLGAAPGRGDGVCANVRFPAPRRLIGDAVAVAAGVDPDADPWLPERAIWPLLDVVDECLAEPWLRLLASHLGADRPGGDPLRAGRRLATVRRIAELLDRYALHRPDMVREWAQAGDLERLDWQARLWRCLRARIGTPGPAERLEAACARLREEPGVVELPERVAVFNLTRLPGGYRDVLRALAAHREVHLFLLHPSPALWDAVAGRRAGAPPVVLRREDPTADAAENRLLASWGQDAREMQVVLAGGGEPVADEQHPVTRPAGTLLARLQADVRANRRPPGAPLDGGLDFRPLLAPGDRSVQVHACHGRARQVEVLRDAILRLLADDPTLEPRDVIVMCPDIETFAPLIHATFGGAAESAPDEETGGAAPDLRVRLADRSLRQTNPVLAVVARVLELADDRLTASQVLDLAGRAPVRRRFRLDDDDLARLEDWVRDSGVRWGLDAERRRAFALQEVPNGTWDAGLGRVLVGVAMTEDERRLVHGVLPLDDVDSGAIDLAGRLAELIDRLRVTVDDFRAPKPVDAWARSIAAAADLLTDTADRDAWQRAELHRLLDELTGEAAVTDAGERLDLRLQEVRAALADRLAGRPTRANFRTGHLTVCTLAPMRSVPHRVVCLLGLDDAVFPRRAPQDGDDRLLEDPRVGERDPRAEDRQMLLDALMAAGERLIVIYTGNDERTNAARPPAVPVGELLDAVDRTARTEDPDVPARDRVLVRHPLQPFDPRNFTAGALDDDAPWSFDRVTLAGAVALTGPRRPAPPFLEAPLEVPSRAAIDLESDLVRMLRHPVQWFLRDRLGIRLGDLASDVDDALPVALDGLERWGVGQRLLDAVQEGADGRAACTAEIARGTLPPGVLGRPVIEAVWPIVEGIDAAARARLGDAPAESADVRVTLPDGRVLAGTVAGVRGDVVSSVLYARVAPKHRLAAWARLLALTASEPERPWRAVTIGRRDGGDGLTVARIAPLADDAAGRRTVALAQLSLLADLLDRASRGPLPLPCATAARYAAALHRGDGAERAVAAALDAWTSSWSFDKEDRDPEHVLAYGGERTLEELRAAAPLPDEHGPGWRADEPSRFGRLALRLWTPLLEREGLEVVG